MHETREQCAGRFVNLRLSRPRVVAQARLFVFLTLLVPLFGVLGGVVADGVPSVEVRVVPREVTIDVPVEVVVERIVDRLVFVPVPTVTLHPWTQSLRGLFGWDLSRLPQAGVASVPAFRPSSERASVIARPDAAVAAGIVAARRAILASRPDARFPLRAESVPDECSAGLFWRREPVEPGCDPVRADGPADGEHGCPFDRQRATGRERTRGCEQPGRRCRGSRRVAGGRGAARRDRCGERTGKQ